MEKQVFTTEQMLSWTEGVREIEKLINTKTFLGILKQSDARWKEFWCSPEAGPVLGMNNGYYKGYEAIDNYYSARHEFTLLKAKLMKEAFPEKYENAEAEALAGVGSLCVENLSTHIIEVAGDGKTAKGIWYILTTDIDIGPSGEPEAYWYWGRMGIDFIKEDGAFKIWHMMYAEDLSGQMGYDWTKPQPDLGKDPRFAAIAEFKLPEPNVPCVVHENFHPHRQVKPIPGVPVRYNTFADTFSYTIM